MNSADAAVPEGFVRVQRPTPNPFNELVGPFYIRRKGDAVSLGVRLEERHCNSRGTCHGGMLATLADIALGYACELAGEAAGHGTSFVTTDLTVEYLAPAHAGDWIESAVQVLNPGSRIANADGVLLVEGRPVVRARATFKMSRALAQQQAVSPEE